MRGSIKKKMCCAPLAYSRVKYARDVVSAAWPTNHCVAVSCGETKQQRVAVTDSKSSRSGVSHTRATAKINPLTAGTVQTCDEHANNSYERTNAHTTQENWKKKQEEEIEVKRRGIDREEAVLQRKLRAETIRKANDKLYEQTGKMKLLRSNLLYAEVIEVSGNA